MVYFKNNIFYHYIVLKNKIKYFFYNKKNNKFLFILSPPYCGSTLLHQVISTSKFVSVNNNRGTREGQTLPIVRDIFFNNKDKWDEKIDLDWTFIRKIWMKYWDLTFPILLEKSPPNILRAKSLDKYFSPAFFLILYRNPYAHCESLIRRDKISGKEAAHFAIKCLKIQKNNSRCLTNSVQLSYEELTDRIEISVKKITQLLPELSDIQFDLEFSAHNFQKKNQKIKNLNCEKFSKLPIKDLEIINDIFIEEIELLNSFNYSLLDF